MRFRKTMTLILCILNILAILTASAGCGITDNKGDDAVNSAKPTDTATPEPIPSESVLPVDSDQNNSNTAGDNTPSIQEKTFTAPVFTDEKKREYSLPAYDSLSFNAQTAPYTVKRDLSNIENLDQFGDFTDEQKTMLSKNGFVIASGQQEQLFYIYENNAYLKLPSFVSADSVLQVYHIFFDYSLRTLEVQTLLGSLKTLTQDMLDKSIYLYGRIDNAEVKKQALLNIAYFAVAQTALGGELPKNIPEEALALAKQEQTLINAAEGFEDSPLLGFKLDYSQFKPRGHYTRSEDLQRFFKAMMWYGLVPFNLFDKDGDLVTLARNPTARALLITYSLFMSGTGTPDIELWENIYDPTVFYVGKADDLTVYDYKDLLIKAFGENPDLNTLLDDDKAGILLKEAKKLPEPQIQGKWISVNTPTGKQFRFMGQRYIPDSEILQTLVDPPARSMPSGLDVMAVLGSNRAYDHLINEYKVDVDWPDYPKVFKTVKDKFASLPVETWQSNMYYGWLWTLKALLSQFGKGYPAFMTNDAWEDKSLSTALGSWSELRHDTILYGKQSGAEGGGGDLPPVVKCYVEPNIELYQKLLWLTRYSRENLSQKGILPDSMKMNMEVFEELLGFLSDCSVKELKNEELSDEEYVKLLDYGGTLERLTSSMAEQGMRWYEITSETDKNMALVADVHTVPGSYLEEGVGPAAEMFVAVPIGGKLYLTRGAAFDYYEFVRDKRLTDEEWQKMLKDGTQPQQPEWTKSFKQGVKSEIPEPEEPYYAW